jgi:hypothetical protein
MSSVRIAGTTALRLLRHAPTRTAVIAFTIALPTAAAIGALLTGWNKNPGLAMGAVGVTAAMLVVAQASSDPTSLTSARGWRAAGADSRVARLPHRIAMCLVGWTAVIVGAAVGALSGRLLNHEKLDWTPAAVLTVGLILVVPASIAFVRQRDLPKRSSRGLTRGLSLIATGLVVAGASLLAIGAASSVRTDFNAEFLVPLAAILTAIAVTAALQPLRTAALFIAGRFARLRPAVTLASRHHQGLLVRVMIAGAMVVAATAATLGGSVGSRERRIQNAIAELRTIPVVPPTVMAITLPSQPANPIAALNNPSSPGFSSTTVEQIAMRFPGSQVIPLVHVEATSGTSDLPPFACLGLPECDLPVVVADPRLAAVYGRHPLSTHFPLAMVSISGPPGSVNATLSVPTLSDLVHERLDGHALPSATWQNVDYLQIDSAVIANVKLATSVKTIFVTRATPYSASDHQTLRTLAAEIGRPSVSVVTSDQRAKEFGISNVVGVVPWAPTRASTQWSITVLAALLALLVVVSTGAVDALDRRRDNQRLERIGATPNQVRAGAALHTGLVLGLAALLSTVSVVGLVARGVYEYSTHSQSVPLTFELPLPQLVFLVLVVPVIGSAIAVVAARPRSSFAAESERQTE